MIEQFFSSLSGKWQKFVLFFAFFVTVVLLTIIFIPVDKLPLAEKKNSPEVLAEADSDNDLLGEISFNIPAIFNAKTTFNEDVKINNKNLSLGTGSISASNIVYSLRPGANISITGDKQNPTISASVSGNFVTTLQGQSGAVALVEGTGITVDGLTIINSDPGSAQDIFKTITVGGSSITASSNNDSLELAAGTGISLATDGNKVTITNTSPSSGGGTPGTVEVTQDGTTVVTTLTTLDFAGSDFTVTESPTGEANITTVLGSSISLTSEVTGILPIANGGTGATTLANLITLGSDTTGNYIATITSGSGLSVAGSGSETANATVSLGSLTSNWDQTGAFDIILNNASSELQILESAGGTFFGTIDVGNLSANRTYTFPDGGGTVCILEFGNCGGGGGGNISGSGTAGQITFFNGANTITSETTGFTWDTTNKRFGLGNDTPGGKLDVTGTSTGQALAIFNETGDQNIIAASASGTTRLVLDRTGNLNIIGGAYQISGTNVLTSTTLGSGVVNSSLTSVGALNGGSITSGFGTIDTGDTITGSTINGTTGLNTGAGAGTQRIDSSGNLLNIGTIDSTYLDASSNNVNLAASTSLQFDGTTVITSTRNLSNLAGVATSLNPTAANTYNLGTGTGNQYNTIYGNTIFQNGNQVCDTTGNCSSLTVTYWDQLNGAIRPKNATVDLLIGGQATSSAKFAVLNVNSGTPTASLSAGAAGGLYLTANGSLQTTNNQLLTVGGSTTGDIILSPRNGSGTVTNTGTMNLASGKTYQINGIDVLTNTTLGASVVTSSLTSVGALNGGSITSGFGTIDTGDTITGTTINGTTGINTGAGAGTQRIDSSGNLANIGTITAGGLISANGGLTVANGQNLTLAGLTTNNNSVLYTNGSGTVLAATTTGSGQCLLSNGSGAAPSWGSCPGSSTANYWQLNNGALSPFSETLDLLVGNTASSAAEFAVRGIAAGTNPTASVSATAGGNAGNGIVLAGDGSIQSFRNNTLTLGGNTTGNIILNPLNGSGSVLSTGDLNLSLGKAFQINGTSVLNSTTLGSSVINSSLTSVGTITSGTWNGTAIGAQYGGTGINTSASTGIPTISGGTWSVSSALSAALGGTGDDTSGTTGVPYISGGNWQYEAQLSTARGGTGVNGSSASNGQLLIGNGSGFSLSTLTAGTGINISNGAGSITISQSGGSTSKWTQNDTLGTLTPNNATLDVLFGGTATGSAKFGILNMAGNTPTASLSAGAAGGTYLTANGLLQTTNNQALTIGGNTTGNIILSPQNGSGTVMSTGTMNLATGKTYQINGTDVLSGTTLGSGVINSSLTSVGILNGGSITSGFGTIDTGDTITGTTINGTTGINSGAGAGTQRIDASGNLANIGTIDSTYLDTSTNIVNLAASTALQFAGTTVIDASRNLNNIAGVTTSLNPTSANTYTLGTGTGNQYNTIYGNTLYQNGNQVCDTSGNCAGGAGGSKWQVNGGVLAPLTATNLLVLGGNTSTVFQMEVNGKVTGKSLVSLNETGDQNILTASASGATVFNINRNGNLQFTGGTAFMNTLTSGATTARTYTLPDGTGTVCLVELGNCAGSGGGVTGSGTAGQIAFFNGAGSITSETSGFAWDATNNKLGIGIDSPAGKFQVNGASTGQALAIFNETGDQNILTASASGTSVFNLDRSGNLAITGELSNLSGATLTVNDNLNLTSGNAFQINGTNVLSGNTLGTGVTASSLTSVGTLTTGVWNATAIGAQYGGTGLNTSASTGVPTISSGTWSVSSALAASLGGTGDDTSGTTGVPYISGGNWQYEAQLSAGRGGTGVNGSSASNGQLLIGNGSGFSLANLTAGSGINISNSAGGITISQAGAGSSKWSENLSAGTLTPNQSTLDVLFGGTATDSAKFGILNMAGGTPTASLSAGTNSGLSLNASGNLQTFVNQSLTIGGSQTGNIILDSGNNVIRLADLTTNGVVYTSGTNGTLNTEAQLAVTRGGTGTGTIGGNGTIAYSNGTNYAFSSAGSTGQALLSSGGSGAPTWTTGTLTLAGNFATAGTSALTLTTTGTTNVTLPTTGTLATLAGSEALTNKTVNGLSLTANADGFSVAGGTSSRTLTVTGSDITLTGGGNTLTLTGNASLNQNLLTSSSPSFTGLTVSGLNTNNNSVLYTNGSGTVLAATTTGTGECLRSNGSGAAPTWSTCPGASASNYWQLHSGAVSPFSETLDLLVGNTASSAAEFSVLGINAGTNPTASVSATSGANSGNGIVIAGDGTIQSLRNNTLNIGGNTTGNIVLDSGNGVIRLADLTTNGVVFTSGTNGTLNSEAQLATARGGLGANVTAAGAGEILYSTGTTTYDSLAAGSAGQALVSGGAGSPTWTTGTLTLAGNFATAGTSALTLTTTGATNVTLPTTGTLATLAGSEALTNKTVNGLSLTANADGFSVAGGTSSRTLNVINSDITLSGGGNTLTLTGNASLNQNLLTSSSPSFTGLAISGLNTNNNSVLYTNGSGTVAAATTVTSGQCLMSNANTPAWATCPGASATNYWQLNSGAVSPFSETLDVLVGSTATTSAEFSVLGVNAGTNPTASVSATAGGNSGNGIVLAGDGSIQSLRNNTLVLGGSTTGNISLTENTLLSGKFTQSGATTFTTGTGQVTLAGNVDATNGLDVTNANLTVGGANFSVAQASGDITTAGDLTVNGGDIVSAATANLLNTTSTTINFAGAATTLNIADSTTSKTIDIGGVTSSGTDTINISTNGTAADTIAIGNTNASTLLSLTGGDDWSLSNTGIFTLSASATQTTAIDVTDTSYTNAISIGDNNILGTTANIDFTNFDVVGSTGNITTAGDLAVNGDDITADSNLTINANGYVRIGDTATPGVATGDDDLFVEGDLEVDGAVQFDNAAFTTCGTLGTVAGALTCGSSVSSNYWQLNNGAISPFSNTLDVLVGGTSSTSAVFKISPSGTSPTASISANTSAAGLIVNNNGVGDLFTASKSGKTHFVIANDGSANIWNRNRLNFYQDNGVTRQGFVGHEPSSNDLALISKNANSWLRLGSTGTGGIAFWTDGNADVNTSPQMFLNSAGRLALGTINALATFDVRGNINSMPAASISGAMAKAALVVDNSSGDLFTASNSGFTRFKISNNGALTSIAEGVNSLAAINQFDANVTKTGSGLAFGNMFRTYASQTGASTGNTTFSTYSNLEYAATSSTNQTGDLVGALNQVNFRGTGSSSGGGRLIGAVGKVVNYSGSGTVDDAIGVLADSDYGGGAVTNSYGFYAANPDGASTVTNAYGLYVADITRGSTNNYAIYAAGGKTFFADQVGINSTPGNAALDITQINVSGEGLVIRAADTGILDAYTFLIKDSGNGVAHGYHDDARQTLIRGNNTFWNSAALQLEGLEDGADIFRAMNSTGTKRYFTVHGGGTTATASVSGTTSFAALVANNSGTGDIFTASSGGTTRFTIKQNGVVEIGNSTNGLVFDYLSNLNNGNQGIYRGLARPIKQIVLSPEYSGAVLTASGSANTNGLMTSDASTSAAVPAAYKFQTYYQWTSSQVGSTMQDYTVAVRVTLPADFSSWAPGGSAMQVKFNTALTTTDRNRLDVLVYNATDQASTPTVFRQAQSSTTQKNWRTVDIPASDLNDGTAWNEASESAMIYLKMSAIGNSYVQVGDIIFNYLSKF